MAPNRTHLQRVTFSSGRRYTSASVHIISGNTIGKPFSQPPVRSPAMLLSPYLMTQNDVPVNVFSFIETGEDHRALNPVYKRDVKAY